MFIKTKRFILLLIVSAHVGHSQVPSADPGLDPVRFALHQLQIELALIKQSALLSTYSTFKNLHTLNLAAFQLPKLEPSFQLSELIFPNNTRSVSETALTRTSQLPPVQSTLAVRGLRVRSDPSNGLTGLQFTIGDVTGQNQTSFQTDFVGVSDEKRDMDESWQVPANECIVQIEVTSSDRINSLVFITNTGTRSKVMGQSENSDLRVVHLQGCLVGATTRSEAGLDEIQFVSRPTLVFFYNEREPTFLSTEIIMTESPVEIARVLQLPLFSSMLPRDSVLTVREVRVRFDRNNSLNGMYFLLDDPASRALTASAFTTHLTGGSGEREEVWQVPVNECIVQIEMNVADGVDAIRLVTSKGTLSKVFGQSRNKWNSKNRLVRLGGCLVGFNSRADEFIRQIQFVYRV
jgi:hypothetical protein